MSGGADASVDRARAGLCADCAHGRRVDSARGSTFWLCRRSEGDPAWPRYPRLPVVRCEGYARSAIDERASAMGAREEDMT